MSQVDWDLLNKRRSCSLLARRALAQQGTPTTPTTASVIAALQVQELIKLLHQREAMLGRGFFFDGATHSSYTVNYQLNPDCPWHEPAAPIHAVPEFSSTTTLQEIWDESARRLGKVDALDFGRELVLELVCPKCSQRDAVLKSVEKIIEAQAFCRNCGAESVPSFFHSIPPDSELLSKTVAELGLPAWEIIWARGGNDSIGFELTGDNPFVNGNAVNPKKVIHGFK
jgi:adenylyltransferase/sulfurtransferase